MHIAAIEGNSPEGDRRTRFRELFEANARYVWRTLLALGLAESDVPDASQQVFLVLHDKLANLDPGCNVRTFIYGICLRVAADDRRRAHRRRESLFAAPPEPTFGPTQETAVSRRQALDLFEAALARLTPSQREVFVLYEIEGLSMQEVASAVGCPLQTAYSRLHAAREIVATATGLARWFEKVPTRSES